MLAAAILTCLALPIGMITSQGAAAAVLQIAIDDLPRHDHPKRLRLSASRLDLPQRKTRVATVAPRGGDLTGTTDARDAHKATTARDAATAFLPSRKPMPGARTRKPSTTAKREQPLNERLMLTVADITARIGERGLGARLSNGATASFDVTVERGTGAAPDGAEILVATGGAVIAGAQAVDTDGRNTPALDIQRAGDGLVLRFNGLKVGAPHRARIDLRIANASSRANAVSTARVTLTAARDGARDETRLGWRVTDCATGYFGALQSILKDRGDDLKNGLRLAQTEAPELPGRLLFSASVSPRQAPQRYRTETRNVSKRTCVRTRRRLVRLRSGRRVRRRVCTQYETRTTTQTVRVPIKTPEPATRGQREAEADLLKLGRLYAPHRGVAIAVRRRDGRHGWITQQVYTNLRMYLGQENHPALCTGADVYVEYLSGNAKALRETLERARANLASALTTVDGAIESLPEQLLTAPGGHPGFGGASLGALFTPVPTSPSAGLAPAQSPAPIRPRKEVRAFGPLNILGAASVAAGPREIIELNRGRNADALIERAALIAGVFAPRAEVARVRNAGSPMRALREAKALLAQVQGAAFTDHARSVVTRAFALVEAAHYVDVAGGRYAKIDSAIFGSMADIVTAQEQHCGCFR